MSAGVPVPATLATNDPHAVVGSAREVGAVVYKPLAGGGRCRRLTDADLSAERLGRSAAAPRCSRPRCREQTSASTWSAAPWSRHTRSCPTSWTIAVRRPKCVRCGSAPVEADAAVVLRRRVACRSPASICAGDPTAASRCWSAIPRRCSPASSATPAQSRCRMLCEPLLNATEIGGLTGRDLGDPAAANSSAGKPAGRVCPLVDDRCGAVRGADWWLWP